MLSQTLRRAATLGVVALVPIVAANAAMVADNEQASQQDDLASRVQWRFEIPAGATKTLIPGGEPDPYNVCASSENSGPVSVHYGPNSTQTLNPGKCQTFETSALSIENPAKSGAAYGTYQQEPF